MDRLSLAVCSLWLLTLNTQSNQSGIRKLMYLQLTDISRGAAGSPRNRRFCRTPHRGRRWTGSSFRCSRPHKLLQVTARALISDLICLCMQPVPWPSASGTKLGHCSALNQASTSQLPKQRNFTATKYFARATELPVRQRNAGKRIALE